MTRPQHSSVPAGDTERMRAAARRLEELLRDAGPNIIVTPIASRALQAEAEARAIAAEQRQQDIAALPGVEPISEADRTTLEDLKAATFGRRDLAQAPPRPAPASGRQQAELPDPPNPLEAKPPASAPSEGQSAAQTTHGTRAPARASASQERVPRDSGAAASPEIIAPSVVPPRPVPPGPVQQQAGQPRSAAAARHGEIRQAIEASRKEFIALGVFSLVINLLMLAGPLFMLQVYDRVMTSGSMPTLVALTIMTAALYAITGLLELVRTRVVVRVGTEIESRVSERIFKSSLRRSIMSQSASTSALRELDNLRQFLSSQGPLTFFDAPWTPIYLLVIFMVHWSLGLAAAAGSALLIAIAWASEARSRGPLTEAGKASAKSLELAETGQRNAESLSAMGMVGAYRARWQKANGEALGWQILTADTLGTYAAMSKTLRLLMQSLMLALGAALALNGAITAGAIIAATIIFGRALAPVEQAIGHWRGFLKARESFNKLEELLAREPEPPQRTALPAPSGRLEVASLRVSAPDTRQLILANVAFGVSPGQMLAVIGPSASGKSTLARTLVGLWPAFSGTIRLDDARLDQWDGEALGRHIGYLPQSVELFSGTVKDNIARFSSDATDEEIVEAAKQAHAHELILALPQGYETELGAFGTYLSSGQRQRIGLARALFRNPALVVLDEPNSNLDRAGDEALSQAIDGMRARGQAIVLVSHRVQAIGKADLLLYLDRGVQRAFGPRAEVMKMFQQGGLDTQPQPKPSQAPAQGGAASAGAQYPMGRRETAKAAGIAEAADKVKP